MRSRTELSQFLRPFSLLLLIELDLYHMSIYICMKYESNTVIFSKDNELKPFF